jgi:HD-GYP domain-containing protein (c-di-GMP phosphodiesterase class II)
MVSTSSIQPDFSRGTVALVRALADRDPNTGEHCDRTQALCLELGKAAALPEAMLATLGLATQLHDIGKIAIPDHILLKQGRLNPDELAVMRTHAQRGFDILMAIPDERLALIAEAVLRHHERFDGNGYPGRLAGEAIPILSRFIAVADGYDAMATERPYHRATDHQSIMRIMFDEKAGKYDPYLIKHFASVIESSSHKSKGIP